MLRSWIISSLYSSSLKQLHISQEIFSKLQSEKPMLHLFIIVFLKQSYMETCEQYDQETWSKRCIKESFYGPRQDRDKSVTRCPWFHCSFVRKSRFMARVKACEDSSAPDIIKKRVLRRQLVLANRADAAHLLSMMLPKDTWKLCQRKGLRGRQRSLEMLSPWARE